MARRSAALKAARRNPKASQTGTRLNPFYVDSDDKNRFFVIEKLLEKRYNEELRRTEYLVRWKNYPPSEDSWEPVDELNINASAMVRDFDSGQLELDPNDNQLHCLCRRPYNFRDGGMVQCSNCFVWFHFDCINMNMEDANSYLKFYCRPCRQLNPYLKCRLKPEKAKLFYGRALAGELDL